VLLEGLRSGRRDWIRRGGADRLHVPFRLPLIPGGERALFAGLEAGAHLVTISGSGSALFAVCARGGAEAVAAAMADAFRAATGHGTGRALEVARLARAR
jgi:homoserine kinase